jgi:hypothetical protein
MLSAALALPMIAGAQDKPPVMPDTEYCSRRDADPQKCLIQDGPPNPNIIIRKPPPAPPAVRKSQPDGKNTKKEH